MFGKETSRNIKKMHSKLLSSEQAKHNTYEEPMHAEERYLCHMCVLICIYYIGRNERTWIFKISSLLIVFC